MKPFKAWLLTDDENTYQPSLHFTRADAIRERRSVSNLIDAKWRVVRVVVRAVDKRNQGT